MLENNPSPIEYKNPNWGEYVIFFPLVSIFSPYALLFIKGKISKEWKENQMFTVDKIFYFL
jgi:hypothetical protein